jgi:hypothetical protein
VQIQTDVAIFGNVVVVSGLATGGATSGATATLESHIRGVDCAYARTCHRDVDGEADDPHMHMHLHLCDSNTKYKKYKISSKLEI